MATYSRSATIDTTQNADYTKESIDDLDTCVDGLITDLNNCHTTTQGDLIYRDTSAVARRAISGTVNKVLTSNGSLPVWHNDTTTITADETVTDTTRDVCLLDSSSNSVTLTLTAATNPKTFTVKAIDITNGCDIACNGSQTIEGSTTYYFTSTDQCIVIRGDQTPATDTWRILSEHIPPLQDNATHTTSGTNETDFGSCVLKQNAIKANDMLEVYAGGTITDAANGSFTLKLYVGATAATTLSITNVNTEDWVCRATIAFTATNAQRISHWSGTEQDFDSGYDTASIDTTGADTTVKLTGTMGNASDSATGDIFIARLIRG